ncbi:MAG: winged helix-turn-helix transcriptional regulator [Nitrospirae bacterium]|nr:winged helix-turn-helix transcriptional regulator [Nitrospirota bacterium]
MTIVRDFVGAGSKPALVPREKTRIKTREKILDLISEDPSVSTEEMSKRIGITKKGIEWQIMRMKKEGILQRIGPAKGGYWKTIEEKS